MKCFVFVQIALAMRLLAAGDLSIELNRAKNVPSPPKPPRITTVERSEGSAQLRASASFYSIGDPTPEEQLSLELINRARANPPAEGALLAAEQDVNTRGAYAQYAVDLNLMQSQFAAIAPAQPLAFSAKLIEAARGHSQDMLVNVFQEHNSWDGRTVAQRLIAVDYRGSAAENVFAVAESVLHAHAGFEVDWGFGAGGMQTPPGHRVNIHNPLFREVGIGIVFGSNSAAGHEPEKVGPLLITQDFGNAVNSTPFITGVAYYDLNGNSFYDIGEGIGGVKVAVTGASFEAITARSGGYAIPVPNNGTYGVTFSGSGFTTVSRTVSVTGSKNLKMDYTPSYSAPVVSGAIVPVVARDNVYSISPVPGALQYEWRAFQKVPAGFEGAENDSVRLSITQTGTYDVIQGIMVKSGSYAFHLAMPSQAPQYITLSPSYLVNSASAITFESQLGYATRGQHAQVQVSLDEGVSWEVIYDQAGVLDPDGDSPNPETEFVRRSVSLGAYEGKSIRIRFAFVPMVLPNEQFVNAVDLIAGWIVDDIQFPNTQEILNDSIQSTTGTTIGFTPQIVADFCLQARAKCGHEFLPWGPNLAVRSVPASGVPEIRLSASSSNGQLEITGNVVSGASPAQLTLESRSSLSVPWQPENVPVQSLSGTQFRVVAPKNSSERVRFYRMRAQ